MRRSQKHTYHKAITCGAAIRKLRRYLFPVMILLPLASQEIGAQLPALGVKYWPLPSQVNGKIMYFLLIGNSNMQGRAVPNVTDKTAHNQVIRADLARPVMGWGQAKEPINTLMGEWSGMGMGLAFGKEYAKKHPAKYVGLLACGVSAAPFSSWVKNARWFNKVNGVSGNGTYSSRDDMIGPAVRQGYHKWGGIIYVWGGQELIDGSTCKATLASIVESWRDALKDQTIPFLIETPPLFTMNKDPAVATAIRDVSTYIPYSAGVDASDLRSLKAAGEPGYGSIETHYSHTSNLILATRFAVALEKIAATPVFMPDYASVLNTRHVTRSAPSAYLRVGSARTRVMYGLVGRKEAIGPVRSATRILVSTER